MTVIFDPQEERQLNRVVALLQRGEAVGLPTETVYGLAGRALHAHSLARIFKLKNRPTFDPLIVHVLDQNQVPSLIIKKTGIHQKLMDAFWPGPLTLLFEKSAMVPDLCTASTPWVALRCPAHLVFREVLKRLGEPLAAPSANRFGRVSTTTAEDVVKELGPYGLEAVLDGGACQHGIESTVVKIFEDKNEIEVVRTGSLGIDQLQAGLGDKVQITLRASGSGVDEESRGQESPGLLKSHYAPRSGLHLFSSLGKEDLERIARNPNQFAYLEVYPDSSLRSSVLVSADHSRRRVLSERSSDIEAASALFKSLRELDELSPLAILVGELPRSQKGLNPAIFDRLRRALSANSISQ
jgi:L-threonylcarbamoyladenylate synthase